MRPTLVEPVKFTRRVLGLAMSSSTTSAASAGAFVMTLTHALRETRFFENFCDCEVRAGRFFGRFEYDRVAVRYRDRDGAHAEDHRRVPRRDADDHADCLARGHRYGVG